MTTQPNQHALHRPSDFVKVDQQAALFHHPSWLRDAVFYEIYPQSFADANADGIGDIQGIIQHLDYIDSLGVTALWLNPCFTSPFQDAGYDVADYLNVAERYGTNDDLIELFHQAHQRGIKVLLDLVPGHTSIQHPWFIASQQPHIEDRGAYSDRYIWTNTAFESSAGMPAISGTTPRDGSYIVNFFAFQPALNYGFRNPDPAKSWQVDINASAPTATREAMREVMRFWLNAGADGFRVDMADSLVKNDDTEKSQTIESWRRMLAPIKAQFPEAAFVSEWSRPWQSLRAGFDMDFYLDWGWVPNGYNLLTRRTEHQLSHDHDASYFNADSSQSPLAFLADWQPQYQNTKALGYFSFITSNHDSPRMAPRLTDTERRIAFALLLLMPGVPFLYYGDEIGMRMQDLVSIEGGYQRTGARTPMQWNTKPNLGFSTASAEQLYLPIDHRDDAPTVAAQEADTASILHCVRHIIAVRHANRCLQADADTQVVFADDNQRTLILLRTDGVSGKQALIAVNPGRHAETCELNGTKNTLSYDPATAIVDVIVGSGNIQQQTPQAPLSLHIEAQSALVILL